MSGSSDTAKRRHDLDDLLGRLGDEDYPVYYQASQDLIALAESADIDTARYLLRRAGRLKPVPGFEPEHDVIRAFGDAAYMDALLDAVPALSPRGRMEVVDALGRIGTPAALDAMLDVLEQHECEWKGWGNPLYALDMKPVHGDIVFPRLVRLRNSDVKQLIDWVVLAYLGAGEVTGEDLAGEPDAADSLVASGQDYLRRLPKDFEHRKHQDRRKGTAAVATAMGCFDTPKVVKVLTRLAGVPDPLVSGNAKKSLERLGLA